MRVVLLVEADSIREDLHIVAEYGGCPGLSSKDNVRDQVGPFICLVDI